MSSQLNILNHMIYAYMINLHDGSVYLLTGFREHHWFGKHHDDMHILIFNKITCCLITDLLRIIIRQRNYWINDSCPNMYYILQCSSLNITTNACYQFTRWKPLKCTFLVICVRECAVWPSATQNATWFQWPFPDLVVEGGVPHLSILVFMDHFFSPFLC